MFNLFDIMRGVQGDAAIDSMARQFGLTPDQVERAMQALLPAFTLGMQGSAREPDAFARTLGLMGSGRYVPFFDNPALAFSQGAMAQGNEALQALFGSKDVSSSVAREAAAFAGIGPEILKQMLPILASILLGGLQRSGQAQSPRRDESGGRGGIFEQILDALRGGSEAERPEVDRRPRRERPRDREPGRDRAGRRAERPERPRRERSTFPESRQEGESAGGGWGDVLADILRGPLPSPTGDADQPGGRTRGPRPGSFDDEMSRRINPDRRPPDEPRREPWPPSDREAPRPTATRSTPGAGCSSPARTCRSNTPPVFRASSTRSGASLSADGRALPHGSARRRGPGTVGRSRGVTPGARDRGRRSSDRRRRTVEGSLWKGSASAPNTSDRLKPMSASIRSSNSASCRTSERWANARNTARTPRAAEPNARREGAVSVEAALSEKLIPSIRTSCLSRRWRHRARPSRTGHPFPAAAFQ